MSRFVPIAANACSTCALAPAPMAIIAMTAPTPMMMPSVVRNERSLLRRTARSATRSVCQGFMTAPRRSTDVGARGRAASLARVETTCPSFTTTTRDANSATSGSWVTSDDRDPRPPSSWKSAMTSTLVRESRLPVGSSARMTLRPRHERARDRDALLLPARELVGVVVAARREAHALERLARARARRSRPRTPWYTSGSSTFSSALVRGEQVEVLEDEAEHVVADVRELAPCAAATPRCPAST